MTNTELKRYLSEHRNQKEEFRAALQVLMTRCPLHNTLILSILMILRAR
ncbi:DUF6887 family protein [Nostoc sp. UHCC 0252]